MAAPVHSGNHAPLRGPLQGDAHIDLLARRGGEPLDHHIVGPGGECSADPVAVLVGPVHFGFAGLEIEGAEIVTSRIAVFGRSRCMRNAGTVRCGSVSCLIGAVIHVLESERHGFAVFAGQHHLPHLGKDVRDLGSFAVASSRA